MFIQFSNKPLQNIVFASVKKPIKETEGEKSLFSEGNSSSLNALALQNRMLAFRGRVKEHVDRMKRVLSNVEVSDVSMHHDAALKAIEKAKEKGIVIVDKPITLLHFDTHSDIYKEDTRLINYGNWINKAIKDGTVNEIYWVMPEWSKNGSKFEKLWTNQDDMGNAEYFLSDSKTEYSFYVEKETAGLSFKKPEGFDANSEKYRVVHLHKITIEELPDMKGKDNVMLDICGDYFSCNGSDIIEKERVKVDPSKIPGMDSPYPIPHMVVAEEKRIIKRLTIQDMHKADKKLFYQLEKKNIKPVIYTGAESPEYVPTHYFSIVQYLLKKIDRKSAQT